MGTSLTIVVSRVFCRPVRLGGGRGISRLTFEFSILKAYLNSVLEEGFDSQLMHTPVTVSLF